MALQWVQQYIHLFNGDASRVTIAGESAGAGSVMLLGMAYGKCFLNSAFSIVSDHFESRWLHGNRTVHEQHRC